MDLGVLFTQAFNLAKDVLSIQFTVYGITMKIEDILIFSMITAAVIFLWRKTGV